MHALVLLSKRVLNHALEDRIHAERTDKKVNVPVVMTRDEVATILSLMAGTPQLTATPPWRSTSRLTAMRQESCMARQATQRTLVTWDMHLIHLCLHCLKLRRLFRMS